MADAKLSLYYESIARLFLSHKRIDPTVVINVVAGMIFLRHAPKALAICARLICARLLHEATFNFVTRLDEEARRANIAPVLCTDALDRA
jgi:hypothetical protein